MKETLSWVSIPPNSDFTMSNFPFGIFETKDKTPRVGSALGEFVIDLSVLEEAGYFKEISTELAPAFHTHYLNIFMALGKGVSNRVRLRLIEIFSLNNSALQADEVLKSKVLIPAKEVTMLMPVKVGDYTDFYSSEEHATNVGKMFRGADKALLPNWKHLPVGYHGRASSIIPSGVPIKRPKGQILENGQEFPSFKPTEKLDFELEIAFITGKSSELGKTVNIKDTEDYIFGFVLFNDWSARDIQKWEYVPLGPFLGKSFASSISPWVVTLEALKPFQIEGPIQNPRVLPYLQDDRKRNFDIHLEVALKADSLDEKVICRTNFKHMYWGVSQQLAHQTVNGCNLNIGDMYGSGTISGKEPRSYGSMLELTWNGEKPIVLSDGTPRSFIHDHDTVIMRGYAGEGPQRVGFGEVSTLVLPSSIY